MHICTAYHQLVFLKLVKHFIVMPNSPKDKFCAHCFIQSMTFAKLARIFKVMSHLTHPEINSVSIHRVYQLDLPSRPHQKHPLQGIVWWVLDLHEFQSAKDVQE